MYEIIVRQIKSAMHEAGHNPSSLSVAIGRNRGYIRDLIRGLDEPGKAGIPKQGTLEAIAKETDKTVDFLRGAASMGGVTRRASDNDDHTKPAVITTLGEQYAAVPRWKMAAGAGAGNVIVPEPDAPYRLLFREEWLRRITPAPLNDLVVLDVAGTSMEPTLMHGDLALIDRTQTERHDDAIYVVLDGNEVKVKRVLIDHATGGLILRSDNPMVKDLPPAPAEVRQIVGKVIWIGRQM